MAPQNTRTRRSCLPVRSHNSLGLIAALLVPGMAIAGEPDDFAEPIIPITSPYHVPEVYGADLEQPPLPAGEWIVYVNFDGADMNGGGQGGCQWGSNKPQNNCSTIFSGNVLPYSGDAGLRAAVVQVIRNDFRPFNLLATDKRPQSGDYDMEMIGDWNPAPQGGFAGVAPGVDCWNNKGGEVSFTLDYTNSASGIAKAALQELAHTWGLEHVDSKGDLLYPTTQSVPDPTFQDECFQIVKLEGNNTVPTGAQCGNQHTMFCGQSTRQNSYRELLQIFGPGTPDIVAPTVAINNPADGAEVDPAFDLQIHLEDNQSPQVLALSLKIDGPDATETDPSGWPSPSDLVFPIKGLTPGEYTITATVVDEDDNQSVDVVTFTVKGAVPGTTTGDDSTTGGGTTSDGTTGDDPTTTDASGSTGGGNSDSNGNTSVTGASGTGTTDDPGMADDESCACRSDGAPTGTAPAMLLLLGLAGARRRRR